MFVQDTTYFDLYQTFDAIKHAIDLNIMQMQTGNIFNYTDLVIFIISLSKH